MLKILLPCVSHTNQMHVLNEVEKAGIPFSLLMLSDRGARNGELPARNALFRMALQDPDWKYCVTLSDDISELSTNWARNLEYQMDYLKYLNNGPKVGALNAYGFVNTFAGLPWAQNLIDEKGNNTGEVVIPDMFSKYYPMELPPNPELSTACCIMRREVLEEVGLFDEGFGKGGGMEHWDYAIRMYQHGWENLLTYMVTFKANIATGNRFQPYDTTTYYRKKYGTHFDGIPTTEFVRRAREWK
jgi:GT2 family glycosyltransferase